MLEYIILGFLMSGNKSGYDLKMSMQKSTSNFFAASFGSIYPALNRLEKLGYIVPCVESLSAKAKKNYQITDVGKAEFMQWLQEPISFSKIKFDYLVKIFFFNYLEKEKSKELINLLIWDIKKAVMELSNVEKQVNGRIDLYQKATLEFGKDYYCFLINWCEKLIEKNY
ncbi:MAG: helix-turn-helix transcriptional regulator [Bacillota bacterium]|nr:helix-turn-helix transcriptional regulator [Bacillota bacterium]